MDDQYSPGPRPIPGGARRADTFLLVVATVLAVVAVPSDLMASGPHDMALLAVGIWLQVLARWLQHFAPRYVRSVEAIGMILIGAGLYAGFVAR